MEKVPIKPAKAIYIGAGFVVIFSIYCIISNHYRYVGIVVPDESYYTLAARLVYEGQLPYLDFSYTQTPLLPYINGAALSIVGFGFDNHRFISSIWGGLGLLVLIAAMRQRTGKWEPAFMAAFVVAASPRWTFLQSLGVWCGATGLFMNLALAAVIWRGKLKARVLLFALAGSVAIGCRLSCAPSVALLAIVFLLEAKSIKQKMAILGVCFGIGLALFVPFIVPDPKAFFFMVWEYHLESKRDPSVAMTVLHWWDVSPAVITLQATALFALPFLIKRRLWTETILLIAGVAGLTIPMIPKSAWGVYISAGIPISAAAAIIAIWTSKTSSALPYRRVVWVLPLMSLFHSLPLEVIEGAATEFEEVATFIQASVEEGPILTPAGIIAVESGRDVIPGTEMGAFSAMFPWDSVRASRFHFTTLLELIQVVEDQDPAAIVLMKDPPEWLEWNFRQALPSTERQPEQYEKSFEEKIYECYQPAWSTSTMRVFVRRVDW